MSGKNPERDKVPIKEKDSEGIMSSEPIVKKDHYFDRMHKDFLDTHDYLRDSISDIDFMKDRLKALRVEREEKEEMREEPVDIKRRRFGVESEVNIEEMSKSKEFKRRKIINKAVILVKRKLVRKGLSRDYVNDNSDIIREKVEEFLLD